MNKRLDLGPIAVVCRSDLNCLQTTGFGGS